MKLSIITINLNNAIGLLKTIESVASQTFSDYEYIIIDGNSKDGSVEVIKNFIEKITFWVSEPDEGIYNAMNKGIKRATGEYLLFLNSGDIFYDNDVLSKIFLKQNEADIICGDLLCIDNENKTFLSKSISEISLKNFLLKGIPHSASFIKKTLFNSYGTYNESLRIAADWEFFLKTLVINKVNYIYIPEIISIFNLNGISNNNIALSSFEESIILDKYYPEDIAEIIKEYIKLKTFSNKVTRNRLILLSISLSENKLISKISNKLLKPFVKPLHE